MRQFRYRQLIPTTLALEGIKYIFQKSPGPSEAVQILKAWRDVIVLKDESRINREEPKIPGYDEWFQQRMPIRSLRKEKALAAAPYNPGQLFSHHMQTKGYEGEIAFLKQKIAILEQEKKNLNDQSSVIEGLQKKLVAAEDRIKQDANLLSYWADRDDEILLEGEERVNAVKERALMNDIRLEDEIDKWKGTCKKLKRSFVEAESNTVKMSLEATLWKEKAQELEESHKKLKKDTDEEINGWKQAYRSVKNLVEEFKNSAKEAKTAEADLMKENDALKVQLNKFTSL